MYGYEASSGCTEKTTEQQKKQYFCRSFCLSSIHKHLLPDGVSSCLDVYYHDVKIPHFSLSRNTNDIKSRY